MLKAFKEVGKNRIDWDNLTYMGLEVEVKMEHYAGATHPCYEWDCGVGKYHQEFWLAGHRETTLKTLSGPAISVSEYLLEVEERYKNKEFTLSSWKRLLDLKHLKRFLRIICL